MKAVILAGGKGTRMREETEYRPKPMVEIGGRPIIWHIMKHLSAFGITDFVIAAGYKSEIIKDYFLNYEARNNDFTLTLGDRDSLQVHGGHSEAAWTVTVADTGESTLTGGRILRLARYLADDPFLVAYGDGLSNVDVAALLALHRSSGKMATITLARPSSRFGIVELDGEGIVLSVREKPQVMDWVNIGYFVFEPEALKYLDEDSALEEEPLHRLVKDRQLNAYTHSGFWQPMDTYKEAEALNEMWLRNRAPWAGVDIVPGSGLSTDARD